MININEEIVSMSLRRYKEVESLINIKDSMTEDAFKNLIEFYDKLLTSEVIYYYERNNNSFPFNIKYDLETKDEKLKEMFDKYNLYTEEVKKEVNKDILNIKKMSVSEFKRWKKLDIKYGY